MVSPSSQNRSPLAAPPSESAVTRWSGCPLLTHSVSMRAKYLATNRPDQNRRSVPTTSWTRAAGPTPPPDPSPRSTRDHNHPG
ncbi:hypothetical protein F7725_005940 [Dissostichus mawsoni]|uniref:Uncharacterized protein n=1 Tax=Dissostichus mawsoni TaxID=36200 RepID=A0A7J5YSZ0_DISMA|nr:hypothetical protein F7725_005940 [Dissostichus mawsoni]